jgi:hypothetical protein
MGNLHRLGELAVFLIETRNPTSMEVGFLFACRI